MKIFNITFGPHRGKHIKVTKYNKTTNGVDIEIRHNVPTGAGKQLRWVQTVTENGSFYRDCGKRVYVDPFGRSGTVALPGISGVCKADDLKPFYLTDAEFTGGYGPNFTDKPGESLPARGRSWIKFVTALTEVSGNDVHHLLAVSWGFDRLATGDVKVAVLRMATPAEMKVHGQALKQMYPTYKFK